MAKKEVIRFFNDLGGKQLVEEIKTAEKLLARHNRRFSARKRPGGNWVSLGQVEHVSHQARGLHLKCQNAWVEVRWLAADCLRVRMQPDSDFIEPFSYAVAKVDWPQTEFEIEENENSITLHSSELTCHINKVAFRIRVETRDGLPLYTESVGMQMRSDGAVRLRIKMQGDETGYGLGERAFSLGLRGKKVTLWNTDPPQYQRGSDPLYHSIPFYLGVHRAGTYGVFWDNSFRGTVDVGAAQSDELVFEAEGGDLRYYLFASPMPNRVLARYTELTGRIYLPPMWALGYQQSRFSYYPQETLLKIAAEFRERGIPCDVVYLDIHYMDGFRVFTWDRQRFPQFEAMIEKLHEQGFKVVAILDPGIKIDPDYRPYQTGIQRDIFLKAPDGRPIEGAVWAGLSHFPDFTHPAGRAWWGEQASLLLQRGIDGFWNDMNEPALFTLDGAVTLPDYVQHDQDGLHRAHLESHNVYGLLMARASFEAQQRLRPEKRPYNITRAGFAGAQRYATTWTGDNSSTWDHLRLSISMVLNMGLSGAPMTGPDVGGFNETCTAELFTRWLQAASLMPYFRSHTTVGTPAQEPWAYGQPYEVINRLTIALRYRLMPYLYAAVAQCREYGWPVVRPLFWAEPDNPSLRTLDDCYLLGDALLVAPVLEAGALKREVYLPAGTWYDYWTNEVYEGQQQVEVPAPLERLPLFVRAGAALPLWPEMPFVNPQTIETLTYRIYPGTFETVLYEDDGISPAYENGDYRWVYITCGWDESHFVIKRRTAGRYTPPYTALRVEIVGFDEEPNQVRVDRQGAPLWFYDDGLIEVKTGDFQQIEVMWKPLPTDRTVAHRPW